MSTGLQVKVVLAGVAARALSRLQWWTRGRIGGFDLHHRLWLVYTLDYRVSRTSYVVRDLCPIGLRAATRELAHTLADVLACGDLRGHLAAWHDVVAGRVDMDSPALPVCICSESGSPAALAGGHAAWCSAVLSEPGCDPAGDFWRECVPAWERAGYEGA